VDVDTKGAEIITDPLVVERHHQWRELAWRHAEEIERFAAVHR
jgi:hypothetical protein